MGKSGCSSERMRDAVGLSTEQHSWLDPPGSLGVRALSGKQGSSSMRTCNFWSPSVDQAVMSTKRVLYHVCRWKTHLSLNHEFFMG